MFMSSETKKNLAAAFFIVTVFVAFFLGYLVFSPGALFASETASRSSSFDVTQKTKLPSDAALAAIASDAGLDEYVVVDGKNRLFGGKNNTFYKHAMDMPLTRFVLGNVEINADGLRILVDAENERRKTIKKSVGTVNPGMGTVGVPIAFDDEILRKIGANSGRAFEFLLRNIGMILLGIAFICQTVMIGYNGLVHDKGFSAIPFQALVFRLIAFFLAIHFFKYYAAWMISFSNTLTDAILPMEAQERLLNMITESAYSIDTGGATIGGLVGTFFRALAYMCIKILIIMRDVLMAITLVVGPTCIAIGYFSTYSEQGNDPMRQYLSGWAKNFLTLLLWGPLAAVVLNGMGTVSILSSTGEVDSIASGIFGLAALFAAKDIPDMSKEFGSVALASLVGMLAPVVSSVTMAVGGSTVVLGGSLAARGVGGAVAGIAGRLRGIFGGGGDSGDRKKSSRMSADIGGYGPGTTSSSTTSGGGILPALSKEKNKKEDQEAAARRMAPAGILGAAAAVLNEIRKEGSPLHESVVRAIGGDKKNMENASEVLGTATATLSEKDADWTRNLDASKLLTQASSLDKVVAALSSAKGSGNENVGVYADTLRKASSILRGLSVAGLASSAAAKLGGDTGSALVKSVKNASAVLISSNAIEAGNSVSVLKTLSDKFLDAGAKAKKAEVGAALVAAGTSLASLAGAKASFAAVSSLAGTECALRTAANGLSGPAKAVVETAAQNASELSSLAAASGSILEAHASDASPAPLNNMNNKDANTLSEFESRMNDFKKMLSETAGVPNEVLQSVSAILALSSVVPGLSSSFADGTAAISSGAATKAKVDAWLSASKSVKNVLNQASSVDGASALMSEIEALGKKGAEISGLLDGEGAISRSSLGEITEFENASESLKTRLDEWLAVNRKSVGDASAAALPHVAGLAAAAGTRVPSVAVLGSVSAIGKLLGERVAKGAGVGEADIVEKANSLLKSASEVEKMLGATGNDVAAVPAETGILATSFFSSAEAFLKRHGEWDKLGVTDTTRETAVKNAAASAGSAFSAFASEMRSVAEKADSATGDEAVELTRSALEASSSAAEMESLLKKSSVSGAPLSETDAENMTELLSSFDVIRKRAASFAAVSTTKSDLSVDVSAEESMPEIMSREMEVFKPGSGEVTMRDAGAMLAGRIDALMTRARGSGEDSQEAKLALKGYADSFTPGDVEAFRAAERNDLANTFGRIVADREASGETRKNSLEEGRAMWKKIFLDRGSLAKVVNDGVDSVSKEMAKESSRTDQ